MKKTAQTLLTAAIFATALGSSAQSQMQQPVQAAGDPILDVQTYYAAVYGPPPSQLTSTETTETTTTTAFVANIPAYPDWPEGTAITTDLIPQPAYGPPRTAFSGDMNWDAIADARDLTLIKHAAMVGRDQFDGWYDMADVNHDGDVDKEDVRLFMEETLGIPKKEEAVTTAPAVTTEALMTTLISTTKMPVTVVYGPPPVTTTTEMTELPETTPDTDIPVPLYGPPSMMQ